MVVVTDCCGHCNFCFCNANSNQAEGKLSWWERALNWIKDWGVTFHLFFVWGIVVVAAAAVIVVVIVIADAIVLVGSSIASIFQLLLLLFSLW